ncbi:uncharacterized protein BCR38DRAFT_429188 [Pseudomassariella vexata]|uniref:Carrier domain-containing protein n=1 Tax=Pseudomassariella vexata TaxID=1141098 RepID=A0A1Y2E3I1_9PEZI|nr:uncharacterized protein BCR38DRAFT_429188 [Pseudomassariella vexata]ORY66082.1 hypothetical protein BCR38DRAFT_429188 [Pseudomassariella vexata]
MLASVGISSASGAVPSDTPVAPLQPQKDVATESDDDSNLQTVDDLVRKRARTNSHDIIVSYPSSGIEYVDYTMQQLDVFAYRAAIHYQQFIPTRSSSEEKPTVVALLGPSNFEYLVTMLALTKLGHTILFLSTRLSQAAIESLMSVTGTKYLLADSRYLEVASESTQGDLSHIQIHRIASKGVFDFPVEVHADTRLDSALDHNVEANNYIYIIHSSGSTGLPKPIYQQQKAALSNYAVSMEMKAFITLPLYHNHGICNLYRAIYAKKAIHMYSADLPLTQQHLTAVMQQHKFEIFYGVPYALKLLSETERGIELLRQLKVVMYGGSPCPDELGDLLVGKGINLIGHYGATEVGQLMTSFRPPGDMAWNYVRENDRVSPFLKWVPRGPKLFECCVVDGWPSKVASNQPDGSYSTKDLFEPHPKIPRAWKYIARMDDTIVLVNGEKTNPVQMEGRIRSNNAVAEAVIFGTGRPYLGVLIIPSESTAGKSNEEIVELLWPTIDSSGPAEAYARISKNMIRILPRNVDYPRTDKGSFIRQAFYKQFASDIEAAYDAADTCQGGSLKALTVQEIRQYLRETLLKSLVRASNVADDADFFSLGLDSLQAIQLRSEILKTVDTRGQKLGQNVVFDYPSIAKLSNYLFKLATGSEDVKTRCVEDEMTEMIAKYGEFSPRPSRLPSSVVVTGTTGSLGAHVAARVASDPTVSRVYCLVRAKDQTDALRRVHDSLQNRRVYETLPPGAQHKIIPLISDFSNAHLGLSQSVYSEVTSSLRSVIHCAWAVNFNLTVSSFERDCIAGVKNLLDLCLAAEGPVPASFDYCSSVSSVARAPSPVPERIPDLEWAQGMGYAQSKSVSEYLCHLAAKKTGMRVRVLRVGQIVADTRTGIWNPTEAITMMMQSALTIGALPKLQETPSWLPVDTVAQAIKEIALSDTGSIFANVTNHRLFRWTEDLLPMLRNAGLEFDEVEPKEWVHRLRGSEPDPEKNPPIKLVDFFASKYDKDQINPSRTYVTETARSLSPALENAPVLNQELVDKFVQHFLATAWKRDN